MEDNELVEKLINGDEDAFNHLYMKYKNNVYAYFLSRVKDEFVAEELMYETFTKVYNNIDRFDNDKGKFYSFIWKNAKMVFIDYLRRANTKQRKFESSIDKLMDLTDGEIDIYNHDEETIKDDIEKLTILIANLKNPRYRMAIELYYMKDLSYKEAAKVMGETETNFKSILRRAKATLRKDMRNKFPDVEERLARKYMAKMIIMIAIGVTAITGLAYATYRIYNEFVNNKITLSQWRENVPESESIISKDEALEKINYYLDVLGEEKVTLENIKLIKDFRMSKVCWIVNSETKYIEIDSVNGDLVIYNDMNDDGRVIVGEIDKIYKELNLPAEYELINDQKLTTSRLLEYSKKYGEIYNKYESVNITINNNRVMAINVFNYKYEDTDVLISKEEVLKISERNNIEVKEVTLDIEIVKKKSLQYYNELYEEIDYKNVGEAELNNLKIDIRKVWKVITVSGKEYLIDSKTGEIFYKEDFSIEKQE